jgi:hypothetical protein
MRTIFGELSLNNQKAPARKIADAFFIIYETKYPRKMPIASKNPKIVLVCAVAFMAGAIWIGVTPALKPLMAFNALGILNRTITVQIGATPVMIRPNIQINEKMNI